MSLNELDHLQAIKNQLLRKRDVLRAEHQEHVKQYELRLRQLEDQVKALSEIQGTLGGGNDIEQPAASSTRHVRGYLTDAINRFITESGKTEFSTAEVTSYLKGLGLESKSLYMSTYFALKRLTDKGKLRREEGKGKFIVQEKQEGINA